MVLVWVSFMVVVKYQLQLRQLRAEVLRLAGHLSLSFALSLSLAFHVVSGFLHKVS